MKKLVFSFVCAMFACASGRYVDLDVKRIIEGLYTSVNGYRIPEEEKTFICEKTGGQASVYGEILFESAKALLEDLQLSEKDVFYDLGSGTGKLVTQVYLATDVCKAGGIELSETRCKTAQKRVQKIQDIAQLRQGWDKEIQDILGDAASIKKTGKSKKHKNKSRARELLFIHEDILKADIKDATVVFTCSTCFPEDLMKRLTDKLSQLAEGLRVLTLKQLPAHKDFKLVKTYTLPMTWSKDSPVYLYVLNREVSPESEEQEMPLEAPGA